MLSYRAILDLPETIVRRIAAWLRARRRVHDRRPWQRAATCWTQAMMFCRWMLDATPIHRLARDHGLSQASAYRYLHEALDVVADHAPDLPNVLEQQHHSGAGFVCLDGTLIATNAVQIPSPQGNGNDWWYSGKHHRHGGNVQVLTDSTGFPIWTSPVTPGSTHDITAAREHALPALYPAAAKGLPTLTDKGYHGAGIGIQHAVKGHHLDPDNRCRNRLLTGLRAPAERANAILKHFKALQKVTLNPWRITQITRSALVIATATRGSW
ncbi:IS5/IS1182 family transposase [Acidipropionibacterium jensenii]|uniref:transposase family protein n=1 Tax=Acidipropionibacterium jensenii TaxID=1749 RepID=UPI000BEF0F98|nr:transposase family protein [Acidipropionibacterium jensenii]AZZ43257.1 IS5/IS1182 family transposase [Acidipropionibacterium jensenii]